MNRIQYIDKGNALEPVGTGKKLILHCVNDKGVWGAGFVLALSKKWPEPEAEYRKWHSANDLFSGPPFELGFIQPVQVANNIAVINMIAQHETGSNKHGFPPVRYYALDECLKQVTDLAKKHGCSVHLPYLMCCALAGGEWDYIELMLKKRLIDEGVDVTVYDFEGKRNEEKT